jgi:cytochrome P450
MRLFYVVPCGVPHGTTRPATLESWELPTDCLIIPLNYHILRDADLWERPEEFNPKRFIGKESGKIEVPEYFMPFQVRYVTYAWLDDL